MTPRPDLLLVTGDIADNGDDAVSYQRFREAIAGLPFPVYPAMGNHDSRARLPRGLSRRRRRRTASSNMRSRTSRSASSSSTRSRSGGTAAAFARSAPPGCSARLAEAPGRPTLLVLHHPPIETGLSWMTENPEADWVLRLRADRRGACQYRRHGRRPSPPPDRDPLGGHRARRLPVDRAAGRARHASRWIPTRPTTGR